jgi:transglutaminase-like putative cysteine protease
MKKNTWCLFIPCTLVLVVLLSGCEIIYPPVMYEAAPIRISYDLSYGYRINSTGTGLYEITYLCDTPEALLGTVTYNLLYTDEYQTRTLFNNTFIYWNVSSKDEKAFELGIRTQVEAESFLVADLNGKDALTIGQINVTYPGITNQYTRVQGNETIRFIDPNDPGITTIADEVFSNAKTNNSFLLAKSLFSWLKQHIQYQSHPDEKVVRPAVVTLSKKQGDCDDLSFVYISLCRALGIPARLIRGYLLTENIDGTMTAIAHAWTEVFVGGTGSFNGWIPVECACCSSSIKTDVDQNFGVESAFHLRLFTDDGSNESLVSSLSGISYITYSPDITISLQSFADIGNYQELELKKLVITEKNIRYYE